MNMEKRLLEILYKNKLSHIGSCLTALPIIEEIYKKKKKSERFILSSGHAHVAHLVVMEKYGRKIGKIHDIHCNQKDGCDVSTGSLGQGLPIAMGMALADRSKNVYCLISDGECAEGSIWEALRISDELNLDNLKIYANINGMGAYGKIDSNLLEARINIFNPRVNIRRTKFPNWKFIKDDQAFHYHVLSKKQYEETQ